MDKHTENLYEQAVKEGKPEKIYWWEAITNCRWQDIDKVLEARRLSLTPTTTK